MAFWRRGSGQGTKGEHDEVVIFGREVIASAYPSELVIFDDVAAELRRGRSLAPRRLRAPVGMGAELGAIAPVLLPVLQALALAVSGSALDWAVGTLADGGRRRIGDLLRRRPGAVELDRAEETAVHDTVLAVATTHHDLDPREAEQLALAVIGALRLRADSRM